MNRLQVRGYGRGGIARELRKRSKILDDVAVLPELPMAADLVFEKVKVGYDKENNMRPYLSFTDGHITGVLIKGVREFAPELNADEIKATFGVETMPEVSCRWDLSNAEIMALVPKCLFGSDWGVDHDGDDCPHPKPRFGDCMELPEEFTSTTWEEIPIRGTMRMLVDKVGSDGHEKLVPIISIEPELEGGEILTNSRVSGYLDLAQYVPDKSYMQLGTGNYFDDNFTAEDFGREDKPSAEPKVQEKPEAHYVPMTPSQKAEAKVMAKLSGEIAEGIEERLAGREIESMVRDEDTGNGQPFDDLKGRYEQTIDGEDIMVDPEEEAAIKRGEAFGYEELLAYGLVEDYKHNGPADHYVRQAADRQRSHVASVMDTANELRRKQMAEGMGLG